MALSAVGVKTPEAGDTAPCRSQVSESKGSLFCLLHLPSQLWL